MAPDRLHVVGFKQFNFKTVFKCQKRISLMNLPTKYCFMTQLRPKPYRSCSSRQDDSNRPLQHTSRSVNKQIHLVGERFILKIHQNTTNYSYIVDVSVYHRHSSLSWHVKFLSCQEPKGLVPASSSDEGPCVQRPKRQQCENVMMNF